MVDTRPAEVASVSPVPEPPPGPVAQPPPAARASTPAAVPPPPTNFTAVMAGNGSTAAYAPMPPYSLYGGGGVKGGMVLCAPPIPLLPPPLPHNVNTNVQRSVQLNGADLPMNDIATLRYFFNLGVEYMWATQYSSLPSHVAPPPLAPPPPRYYSPVNDLAQDMQQNLSLHERTQNGSGEGKQHDKPHQGHNIQGKPAQQRPLIAPRFRGVGGDGGGTLPHQNRNFNNNKGRFNNNRRNSHGYGNAANEVESGGGGGGEAQGPVYTMPYMQYPPVYHYYPVEADPGAMGMMGYVSYPEEAGDYYSSPPMMPPYFPPLQHHPPLNPHHAQQ